MKNEKIITIRLKQNTLDMIEEIKTQAFEYTPPDQITTTDVIKYCIGYTNAMLHQ